MNFLATIKALFSGEKGVIDQVGDLADRFITTKEEKNAFLVELKKLEAQRVAKAEESERKLTEQYLNDVKSARHMQVAALNQQDRFSKRFVYYLSAGILLASLAYIYLITFYPIPAENVRYADTVLGVIIGSVIMSVVNFFFGSSEGSKEKSKVIEQNLTLKRHEQVEK